MMRRIKDQVEEKNGKESTILTCSAYHNMINSCFSWKGHKKRKRKWHGSRPHSNTQMKEKASRNSQTSAHQSSMLQKEEETVL